MVFSFTKEKPLAEEFSQRRVHVFHVAHAYLLVEVVDYHDGKKDSRSAAQGIGEVGKRCQRADEQAGNYRQRGNVPVQNLFHYSGVTAEARHLHSHALYLL